LQIINEEDENFWNNVALTQIDADSLEVKLNHLIIGKLFYEIMLTTDTESLFMISQITGLID
jgi:hypothetical protein